MKIAGWLLGVDDVRLRTHVLARFRSDAIVAALERLYDLGFVPSDLLGALLREGVRDRALPATTAHGLESVIGASA